VILDILTYLRFNGFNDPDTFFMTLLRNIYHKRLGLNINEAEKPICPRYNTNSEIIQ
jgi:hypothetical protein